MFHFILLGFISFYGNGYEIIAQLIAMLLKIKAFRFYVESIHTCDESALSTRCLARFSINKLGFVTNVQKHFSTRKVNIVFLEGLVYK